MKTLTTILAVLSFALCIVLGLASSDLYKKVNAMQEDPTSLQEAVTSEVNNALCEYFNPTFLGINDVHEYATSTLEYLGMQEEFLSIPEDVLLNVASVLIKQNGHTTIAEILNAYKQNQTIYDNLPKPTPTKDSVRTETIYIQTDQLKHLETPPESNENNNN